MHFQRRYFRILTHSLSLAIFIAGCKPAAKNAEIKDATIVGSEGKQAYFYWDENSEDYVMLLCKETQVCDRSTPEKVDEIQNISESELRTRLLSALSTNRGFNAATRTHIERYKKGKSAKTRAQLTTRIEAYKKIINDNEANVQPKTGISSTWAQEKIAATNEEIAQLSGFKASTTWVNNLIGDLVKEIVSEKTELNLNAAADANATLFRLLDTFVQTRRQRQKKTFAAWTGDELIDIILGKNKDWDDLFKINDQSDPKNTEDLFSILDRSFNLGSCVVSIFVLHYDTRPDPISTYFSHYGHPGNDWQDFEYKRHNQFDSIEQEAKFLAYKIKVMRDNDPDLCFWDQ